MTSRNILSTVIKDLFKQQFKWTMAFIGIMLLISTINIGQAIIQNKSVDDYYSVSLIAGDIYMFVIGILCIFFLKYFVEHGITRRNYFKGALVVATSLAVFIPIITLIIYKLQMLIASSFVSFKDSQINEVVTDIDNTTSIFDDIIVALVTAPHVDPDKQTLLALAVFSINLLFYYLAGWLIGAAFQYPVIVSLGITALVAGIIVLQDALIRIFLEIPVLPRFDFMLSTTKPIALVIIFAIIVALALAIKQLTKKTIVNM